MDATRCIKYVVDPTSRMGRTHQCVNKRGFGQGGEYCRQHDPAVVAQRQAKSQAKHDAERLANRQDYENAKVGAWLRANRPDEFEQILKTK